MAINLQHKYALAYKIASDRNIPYGDWDDTVQEAVIAVWRKEGKGDNENAYANQVLRRTVWKSFMQRNWTGKPSARGKQDALNSPSTTELSDLEGWWLTDELDHDSRMDVMDAISELDEDAQEYVYRRFYLGESSNDVQELRDAWRRHAVPQLRERLGHLNEV